MLFTRSAKESVVETIIGMVNYSGRYTDNFVEFLNRIWPLRSMPSTDIRFKDAYGDFVQHLVNNSDWEERFVFFDRLKILDEDEQYFVKFLEFVVSPEVRRDRDDIVNYVAIINSILSTATHKLILSDYFESLPVYKVLEQATAKDLPADIAPNSIPFYKRGKETGSARPYFLLSEDNWDDYGFKTRANLTFYPASGGELHLGWVKITKRNLQTRVWDILGDSFFSLSDEFCSLGQSDEYYRSIKNQFGAYYHSILFALRDGAYFPKIHEQFESEPSFRKSLLRTNDAELVLRTVRFQLNGIDLASRFIFKYNYSPPYSNDRLSLFFNFKNKALFEHRIFALIGKNGTGKTKLLASLAKDLSERNPVNISPHRPIYGKVFTVSYSYFDRFEIPEGNAEFNYVYCGLKKRDGTWMSKEELMIRFLETASKIVEKELVTEWYGTLSDFISSDLLNLIFISGASGFAFMPDQFAAFSVKLSSGQNILVYMISEILAQIRLNSLILYDEPETHLHPNAISSLMFTIFNLVRRFDSFCIIATHSPMVIQEIPSQNIFIIERNGDRAEVRTLQFESFGENLTVITDEIFGNRVIAKHQTEVLERLAASGRTYEEILEIIQSGSIPVPLNTRLLLQSLMSK